MPRGIDRIKIKAVIDALRKTKRSWIELKEETKIPDKSLARILKDYLKFWGLIEKKKDEKDREKWVWAENIKVYPTVREFNLHLDHSQKLLPAIGAILAEDETFGRKPYADDLNELTMTDTLVYKDLFLQHLETEYPEIYKLVLQLRNILKEWSNFLTKIGNQYETEIDKWIFHRRGNVGLSLFRNIWGRDFERETLSKVKSSPFRVWPPPLEEHSILKFFPEKVIDRAISIQTRRYQTFKELRIGLERLRIDVDMGTPLDGHCNSCPKIRIVSRKAV